MSATFFARDLQAFAVALIGGGVMMAATAWAEMYSREAAYGLICGLGHGPAHCAACYVAVGLLTGGGASLTLAAKVSRQLQRAS